MDDQATLLEWPQLPSCLMAPPHQDGNDLERRVSELRCGIKVEENFQWIFTRLYDAVFHFFAKRAIAPDRCEDLTQEVFLRVYRGIERFRGESKFTTWLFHIALNLWYRELRITITKGQEVFLDATAEPDSLPAIGAQAAAQWEQDNPLLTVLIAEHRVMLHGELETMPPQMRRCILLRIAGGLKYREIAVLMQLSIDTVKSHLNQAKSRLKERLQGPPAAGDS